MKNVLITEVSETFSLIIQNSETHALAFPNIHSSVRYQKSLHRSIGCKNEIIFVIFKMQKGLTAINNFT